MDTTVVIVVLAVLLLAGAVALVVLRRARRRETREDTYAQALEAWLAGDRSAARALLQELVRRDPHAFAPYLQLGILLREDGDPARAAALHQGLVLRRDLDDDRRTTARLALAEDLLAAARWEEAGRVLDELAGLGRRSIRYWRLLFRRWAGAGDTARAADVLKQAARRAPRPSRDEFRLDHGRYQVDRALAALRDGDPAAARRLVRPWRDHPGLSHWAAYVEGMAAEAEGDHERAVDAATRGMRDDPTWSDLFLPVLQSALLATGRYQRVLPILEEALQSPEAPPSLWIAKAMLHEKLGQREQAVRLLVEKAGDPRLTPALAAPLLRILVRDLPDCDFTRVWGALHLPREMLTWQCEQCGAVFPEARLCCPRCLTVGRIAPVTVPEAETS